MRNSYRKASASFILLVLGTSTLASAGEPARDQLARGAYLATIMDCSGCHTPGALTGQPDRDRPLAGSEVGFKLPGLGVFYPPNLSSDAETGIGRWRIEEIVAAVRTGVRPDGRILAPVMPYHNYAALTDSDAAALAVYLKSLKPMRNKVPDPVGETQSPSSPYLTVVVPK